MTWDLQAGKARLGIAAGDTTKDAFVTAALNVALAAAEGYCNRKFLYAVERATFTHESWPTFQLQRFPIEQVVSMTCDGTAISKYHVQAGTGLVITDGIVGGHQVTIDYAGGFKSPLPADLLAALWMCFDAWYPSISQVGSTGAAAGGGAIRSISSGGSKVDFFEASAGGGGGGLTGLDSGSGLPFGALNLLQPYRLVLA